MLACSIVAKKLHTRVSHVESGIRSGDLRMPEEINRLVTDSITDYFFTTSEVANINLSREGKRSSNVFFVGNTMIDTLLKNERSEEHTSELQSLMRISYAVFCLKKKNKQQKKIAKHTVLHE